MRVCVDEGILQSYFDGELSSKMAEGVASHLVSCSDCAQAARELESESLLLSEALGAEFAASVPTEQLRQRIDAAIAGRQVVEPEQASLARNAGGPPAVPVGRRWVQSVAELFTLAPQRAFAYAGLAAVILFASLIGGIYWRQATSTKGNPGTIAGNGPLVPSKPTVIPQAQPTPSPAPLTQRSNLAKTGSPGKRNAPPNQSPPRESPHVKLLPGERSYLKTIATLNATLKAESNRQMKPSLQVEYERNLAMVDQAIAATRSAAKVNPSDPDAADFMFAAYQSKIDLLSQVADSRLSNRQR